MMKKYYSTILSCLALSLLTACSDYLDKQPSISSSAPITEASQLFSLYDSAPLSYEQNYSGAYIHDDAEITRDQYIESPSVFSMTMVIPFYAINSECMAAQNNDKFWNWEYTKIFRANVIIQYADKVSGDPQVAKEALANAYFMRAYSMTSLANYYCLPYCKENLNALGLPMRLSTDFEESLTRVTLEQTYKQIFADLKMAENVTEKNVDSNKPWRTSLCAVYGLYSRLYLTMGEYDKALEYTNKAMQLAPELMDYNDMKYGNSMSYPADGDVPAQTLEYCETNSWYAAKFLYWKEWIYARVDMARQWWNPSKELTDSFDKENDLRFKLFFVEHGNRRHGSYYDSYAYAQFGNGMYVKCGLTTGELYLMKAELLVRTGKWQEGLSTLDALRAKRFVNGMAPSLTASNQEEALKQVLAERRREMPFTARLADIKRFSVNETPDDDITIKRNFFEVTLSGVNTDKPISYSIPGNSPKLAMPISNIEIISSLDAIEQNPFE